MKLRNLTLFFAALAACGKANDVAAVTDEANGVVAMYKPVVDHLQLRVDRIERKKLTLPPEVQSRKSAVDSRMSQLKRELADAPGRIAMHGSGANARMDLALDRDSIRRNLDHAVTEVNANLDTIDSWIAAQEYPRLAPAAPPTPEPTPTPNPEPEPDPTLENEGSGSAAPPAPPAPAPAPAGSGSAR